MPAGFYTIAEGDLVSWVHTTATSNEVEVVDEDVAAQPFGNVCLGAGGGKTLGFWSNKNSQARIGADDLLLLRNLNLRDAPGANFDPTTYSQLRT